MDNTNVVRREDTHLSDQAYWVLKLGFVLAPIIAGLDKFFNFLTDWTQYLAPVFPSILNITPQTFMYGVGVIEVIAGIGVLFKPKIFAYVVSAWMVGIIVNLFILGGYYDIALRDLGLSFGAYALGRLAVRHEEAHDRASGRRHVNRRTVSA